MLEKVKTFVSNHLDFRFYSVTWIALAVGLAIIPALMYMPQKYGYENGLLEGIQMVVLFGILGMCLTSKVNKRFFRFAALALTIIMIREVNCGRTLFFHIPGTENSFYSWKQIKYGYLVHPIYGAYIGLIGLTFLCKKLYVDMWNMIKNIKLPVWNLLFMGFASFCGAIAEKATNNNFIFEEGFELLFYVALAGIVYLYSRHENFALEQGNEI
jgi:hypothetical protein